MKLSVLLEAVDRVTAPVKRITAVVSSLGRQVGFDRLAASARATGTAFLDTARQATVFAAKLTAAGSIVSGALIAITISAASVAGATKDAAERIGITTQELQRLGYAAKMTGSDQAELGSALTLLNRQVDAAVRGNKTARAEFRRMGISLRDASGKVKSTETVFRDLAERISRMPDGAAKSAAAMRVFGRSGANLIPTLNLGAAGLARLGSEAERFGVVLADDTIGGIDEFGKSMDRWHTVVRGLQFEIVGGLVPALQPLLSAATEWLALNRGLITQNITAFVAELPRYLEIAASAFRIVSSTILPLVSALGWLSDLIGPTNTALLLLSGTVGIKMVLSALRLARTLWPLSKAFIAVGVSLGKLAFASIASVLGTFILALQTGTGVMGAFNAVLIANPIGAVVLAVAALAGAAYLIYRNWGAVSGWFKSLGNALISIVEGVAEVFAGIFTLDMGRIVGGLKKLWGGWADWFTTLFEPILGIIKRVGSYVGFTAAPPPAGGNPVTGDRRSPSTGAASVDVSRRQEVGGELHVRIDAEGRPQVQKARSASPHVPLSVDTGTVMP